MGDRPVRHLSLPDRIQVTLSLFAGLVGMEKAGMIPRDVAI